MKSRLILPLLVSLAACCLVEDELHSKYDLQKLDKPNGYIYEDLSYDSGLYKIIFKFSLCSELQVKCKNQSSPAFDQLLVQGYKATEACDILGKFESRRILTIDGIA